MEYFGETYQNEECGMCDNCLSVDAEVDDLTVQSQKFLSCVARTDQTYGAYYIADVLRGSQSKKVLGNGHDELSTYDIGQEWSKEQWILLGRMLVRQGYLKRDETHGSLKLEDQAKAVLKGQENVFGVLDRTDTVIGSEAINRTSSDVENQYDKDLFEQLRAKRKELADSQAIPPYTIFPDTTLMEMAFYFPQSQDNLLSIYGVGSAKQKKYGKDFLKIITSYCEENGIEEMQRSLKKKKKKTSSGKKHEQIAEAFNGGQSIEHLAEEYGVKQVTILKHLKTYLEEGHELRTEGIAAASSLSNRKRDEVMKSMKKVGVDILRPVYEDLDKLIGYDELRVMQLYYLSLNE
jgi:ATP-dependent DNA helicase RecQ